MNDFDDIPASWDRGIRRILLLMAVGVMGRIIIGLIIGR